MHPGLQQQQPNRNIQNIQNIPSIHTRYSNQIFVRNLDPALQSDVLFQHFQEYNPVRIVHPYNKEKKQYRSYAFITFSQKENVQKALAEKSNTQISIYKTAINCVKSLSRQELNKPNCNIFVKNLDENLSYREFFTFFRKFGDIDSVRLTENEHGQNLGYGYVQFSKMEDAIKCLQQNG